MIYNIKEKSLDPFLKNENFRRAIKDYDKRIRNEVSYLMDNLCKKYNYTQQGAQEICIYVIDNDLAKQFERSARS